MNNKKNKTLSQILRIIKVFKKQGKKIVTYNGSFDILHLGHLKAIKEAKKQGDILIILLNTDESIRMYKGLHHPINQENSRLEMLACLDDVDYIVTFDDINPLEILSKIQPNIHCNGSDWGKSCIERSVVEKHGGKIHILNWQNGFSTSNLIKNILSAYSRPEVKAIFLDRDGTINIPRKDYVQKVDHFRFATGALNALKKLSQADYKIIIITNQSGIGRKVFKENELKKIHQYMALEVKKSGGRIDAIYYCPHHPNDNCNCRKPKIGMFLKAVKDFNINLSKSWFIGDDQKDVVAGRYANIKTIKLGEKMPAHLKLKPNYYAKNLIKAVKIITNEK